MLMLRGIDQATYYLNNNHIENFLLLLSQTCMAKFTYMLAAGGSFWLILKTFNTVVNEVQTTTQHAARVPTASLYTFCRSVFGGGTSVDGERSEGKKNHSERLAETASQQARDGKQEFSASLKSVHRVEK